MSTDLQHLGKYELRQRLAHNSMAEIWKSYDSQLRRFVAMKFLRANLQTDPDFSTHFVREAEIIASLHHPNIVRIHDFGLLLPQTPGTAMAYLVMDWIEGQTLAEYIGGAPRIGKVPPGADILQLFTSISLAIDYAHRTGITHGSLKPTNIFLHGYSSLPNRIGEPLVTDFGLVGLRGASGSIFARRSLETALYMSPEQSQGLAGNERSDIYSLGIILYEMCTGVLPFQGNRPIALMMQHLSATPTPPSYINPSISPALSSMILRCLAKDPQARFPSTSTMTAALAKALDTAVPEQLDGLADLTDIENRLSLVDTLETASSLPGVSSSSSPQINWRRTSGATSNADFHASPSADAGQDGHLPLSLSYPLGRKGRRNAFLPFALVTLILVILVGSGLTALLSLAPRSVTPTNAIVGHAFFVSSGQLNGTSNQGIIDELQVDLHNLAEPVPGKSYYAWLLPDKTQSEAPAILLGKITMDHGNVRFLYQGDQQHTNLLKFTSRFLISEEDSDVTPSNPSPDPSTWHYYAEIPQTPIPGDKLHFSMLDHFRHLLVESPELSVRGLHGGMAIWLLENARRVLECANGAKDAWSRSDAALTRSQLKCVVDYLDGTGFVHTDVPSIHPLAADEHDAQVALLGSTPNDTDPPGYVYNEEVPPGYVYLIGLHLKCSAVPASNTGPAYTCRSNRCGHEQAEGHVWAGASGC